jgi:hypothetical protein
VQAELLADCLGQRDLPIGRQRRRDLPDATRPVVHCDGLDLTGALALRAALDDARAAGLRVELVDVAPQARRIVSRVLPSMCR